MTFFCTFNTLIATFAVFIPSFVGEWVQFVDPEGQFEVFMPDTATVTTSSAETPIGVLEYVAVSSSNVDTSGQEQYTLTYCQYPEGSLHQDSTELVVMLLEETVSESVRAFGGTLIYDDRRTIAGAPGMIWKMRGEIPGESGDFHEMHMKCQAFVAGSTFYCLQAIFPGEKTVGNASDRFFNSFKLLQR